MPREHKKPARTASITESIGTDVQRTDSGIDVQGRRQKTSTRVVQAVVAQVQRPHALVDLCEAPSPPAVKVHGELHHTNVAMCRHTFSVRDMASTMASLSPWCRWASAGTQECVTAVQHEPQEHQATLHVQQK